MESSESERKNILAQSVLISTYLGEHENANNCMQVLNEEFGWSGVAYAVFLWMDIAAQTQGLAPENYGPETFATLMTVKDGELVGFTESNATPAATIAMQAFATFLSCQFDTAAALLATGAKKGYGSEIVSTLLSVCVSLAREELDRRKDEIVSAPGLF